MDGANVVESCGVVAGVAWYCVVDAGIEKKDVAAVAAVNGSWWSR